MYAELHCKSNFSFLQGASHAHELIERAARLGYTAVAITDRNTLAGIVRAHGAARDHDIRLIVGAELVFQDAPPCVVWVPDRIAYAGLCRMLTEGRRRSDKGECELWLKDLKTYGERLMVGIIPYWSPEHEEQSRDQFRLAHRASLVTAERLESYRDIIGESVYLLAEVHRSADDDHQIWQLSELSEQSGIPLIASGDVHYHDPSRSALQEVLTAIAHGKSVQEIGQWQFANFQRHLRSREEINDVYRLIPDAVKRTQEVVRRCQFSLSELKYEYPEELAPRSITPMQHLRQQTWLGAHARYPRGISRKVQRLLKHELELIEQLQYEAYFLTVWDMVQFARSRSILCQGRGSAANSAVCFCLGVTSVDPETTDVLFERFISRERDEAPDIDVDFEHERREEVLQYLYEKYGRHRTGMTAVVSCYRMRSAIREVAKALGFGNELIEQLAKNIDGRRHDTDFDQRCREVGLDPEGGAGKRFYDLVHTLIGFPRHLSQHVGGMVMTRGPLDELVPIENAAMPGRTVIQWNKDDLDELGILKVDCLSLGMLSAIRKCFTMLETHEGKRYTLATVPKEDSRVYDMICAADTVGVFQIESRAQMSMLPRLKPRCFYDLVVEVAIVRPGPIQGDMVHPYLRRRSGQESVSYPNDAIRQVLEKTLGVPLFQEQAMRLAVVAAGFTPGEADQLRRAMGAWRRPGVIHQFHEKLVAGMLTRGLSQEFAEQVFNQIRGFGEYGFPESHAASFALLVYISAWLKYYHPAVFAASIINSQPMGFYSIAHLVRDARNHQVDVREIDVNRSDWDCTLEYDHGVGTQPALRLGFRVIVGMKKVVADRISDARRSGNFASQQDLQRRADVSRKAMMKLAEADAFSSLEQPRRDALWEAMAQQDAKHEMPLFANITDDESDLELPEMKPSEQVEMDYRTSGLSLKGHPVEFCRDRLNQLGVLSSKDLLNRETGDAVQVAGLVVFRQRPSTAKGVTFVTLEDETGTINLVVYQNIWERFYKIARLSNTWMVSGTVQSEHSVIHVVVRKLEDLEPYITGNVIRSRDFR